MEVVVEEGAVRQMLERIDTALNPLAIAEFLGHKVDPYLRKRARARFSNEGDDASGKWAPLQEATQQIRASMGYGPSHPINRREDELYNYVTQTQGRVSIEPLGASLTFPPNYPGGDLGEKLTGAQLGGTTPSGRSWPARKVYALGESDLQFVLLALTEHVSGGHL